MKAMTLVGALLLGIAGFGAGFYLGRQKAPPAEATSATGATTDATEVPKLPEVTAKRRPAPATDKNSARMSIAEVEGALLELRDLSRSKMWERMQEIIQSD